MQTTLVQLRESDTFASVCKAIEDASGEKVIFLCPRDLDWILRSSSLKKIKTIATEKGRELLFVVGRKLVRDFLKSQGVEAVKALPEEYAEETVTTVSEEESVTGFSSSTITPEEKTMGFSKRIIAHPMPTRSRRALVFFITLGVIVMGSLFLWWMQPRAVITIKPKISSVPVIQNVLLTFPDSQINPEDSHLPKVSGIFKQSEVLGKEQFFVNGREYDIENARGLVTLFNETSQPKYLLPSRLSNKEGAIFRFANEVQIPPREGNDPGSLTVEVVADEFDENENPIGSRGNIPGGTELFFPALKEPSRELYYARADKGPLVGGSTLTHYFVAQDDPKTAEAFLEKAFREKAVEKLHAEIDRQSEREARKYIFLDDEDLLIAVFSDFVFPENMVGKETATVDVSGRLELSGLVFDQSEVEKILLSQLKDSLDERQKVIDLDPDSAEYRVLNASSFAQKKWVKLSAKMVGVKSLDVNSKSPKVWAWREKMKQSVVGESTAKARAILANFGEIESVLDIKMRPFWAKKLPTNPERIEFKDEW